MAVVYPKLMSVTPLEDHCLMLTFEKNEKRVYDFTPNLSHKYFSQLADVRLFQAVSVIDGEIEWATGQDFCPVTLYEKSLPTST